MTTANRVVPDRYGVINIGKLKENLVTEVSLPAPGFSGGSYAVLLKRPKEEQPYPVSARHDGNSLVWTVQTADTAIAGMGKLECRWYGDNGEVAKSETYMVRIKDGLSDPTEAPEAWAGFLQQVSQDAGRAESAADNAAKTLKKLEDGIASGDFRGEKGEKGEKGDTGPQGPQGEHGPAGDTTAAAAAAEAAKQAAQEAQKAAEASAGSAAQAAESVGGLADDLEATQKDLAKMKRAIQFQAELSKGQVWDFETDDQEAYQRTVPSGAKAGAVMEYGGKTVEWNQLLSNLYSNIKTITGTEYMSDIAPGDVASSTIVQSLTSNGFRFNECIPDTNHMISGHTYMLSADIKYTTAAPKTVVRFQYLSISDDTSKDLAVTQNWQHLAFIAKMKQSIHSASLYVDTGAALAAGDTVELKNASLVDLTLLYGHGNEPTDTTDPRIAQIEAYAAAHPEYNAGELVSALVDEVRVRGRNLLDYKKAIATGRSKIIDGGVRIVNVDGSGERIVNVPVKIKKGATYQLRVQTKIVDGNWPISAYLPTVSQYLPFSKSFVANGDDKFIGLYLDSSRIGTVDVTDIQLEESTTATAYSPYHEDLYPIPSAVRSLPGYGWSAGSVSNTIECTENSWQYVQRVGSVDLGKLTWWVSNKGTYQSFGSAVSGWEKTEGAVISPKFRENLAIVANGAAVGIWLGVADRIYVCDGTSTTVEAISAAMQGETLYYELATPITTDITALMGDSLAPFAVEAGGSITLHHPKADEGYEIDVPAKVQYITKLSEVSANG